MATVTHAVTTAVTTNGTSYASGSFTPAASDLLIAFVRAGATTATGTMTDSQSIGFTKVGHATFNASGDRVYCFVANGAAAASSMTVTFDCTGDAADGSVIFVARVAGMPRYGTGAIKQSIATNNGTAGGTPSSTFSLAALSGNPTLGCVGNAANPATLTPPSGWTEQADSGYATPTSGAEYVSRDSGSSSTTITWGGTSATAFGVFSIELDSLPAPLVNVVQGLDPPPAFELELEQPQSRLIFAAIPPASAPVADPYQYVRPTALPLRPPFNPLVTTPLQLLGDDASSTVADVALADTGNGADNLAVTATVPLSDTRTGSDALTVTATVALADTGTGADALTVTATVPLADTGSGVDDLSVSAPAVIDPYQAGPQTAGMFLTPEWASFQLAGDSAVAVNTTPSLPDTGTGNDSLTVTAIAPLPDTGSGSDALAVTVAVALADTASGADALMVTATISLADSSTGADSLTTAATVTLADTGTGADALAVTAAATLADTGAAADALTVTATAPLADTAVGADSLSVLDASQPDPYQATVRSEGWNLLRPSPLTLQFSGDRSGSAAIDLPDAGASTDTMSVSAVVSVGDTGAGSDSLSVTATVALADTGSGAEALAIAATVALSEGGAAADAMSVSGTANPALIDSGTASDALGITATVPLPDTATGADVLATVRVFTTTDTGTGTDVAVVAATVPLADTGTAVDALAIVATRPLADTATGVDALSVQIIVAVNLGGDTGAAAEAISIFAGVTGGTVTGGQLAGAGVRGGVRGSANVVGAARGGYVTGGRR